MNSVDDSLRAALDARQADLRPPEVVMAPAKLGAARLTRYSFSRTMLRRPVADGWTARRARLEIDAGGRGIAVYEIDTGTHRFSFVAFTTTIDESEHTDRVIAEAWEISAGLIEGDLTEDSS